MVHCCLLLLYLSERTLFSVSKCTGWRGAVPPVDIWTAVRTSSATSDWNYQEGSPYSYRWHLPALPPWCASVVDLTFMQPRHKTTTCCPLKGILTQHTYRTSHDVPSLPNTAFQTQLRGGSMVGRDGGGRWGFCPWFPSATDHHCCAYKHKVY